MVRSLRAVSCMLSVAITACCELMLRGAITAYRVKRSLPAVSCRLSGAMTACYKLHAEWCDDCVL